MSEKCTYQNAEEMINTTLDSLKVDQSESISISPTECSSSASMCIKKINNIISSIEDSLSTSWALENRLIMSSNIVPCKAHAPVDCNSISKLSRSDYSTAESLKNLSTNLKCQYNQLTEAYEKLLQLSSNQSDKLLKYEKAIELLRKKNKLIQEEVTKKEKTITRVCSKYLELKKKADSQEMQLNRAHQEKKTLKHKLKTLECNR